ncbi:hypothetical protein DPMN_141586 [Dreissena polymorpha]|uniref:Uncharacterized protein n=1 Tax=Dreissena polymorpha TaxID=45954 RepID=A0A9D4G9N1_DREPO|nr:hypothetical protein DPMN_141586 [Dreissena polymorpha]
MKIGHKISGFELDRYIFGTKLLTKFHEDRTRNVASRVKTSPPTGGHVFSSDIYLPSDLVFDPARPSFELDREFIKTKLLTKFHVDRTRNVASRVFTNKC